MGGQTRTTLVTGGAGFLGSRLVRSLVAAGERVRVLDDLSTGDAANLAPGVELVRGCVLDERAVAAACAGVDRVVHLAGVVGMRLAVALRAAAHDTACHGTRHLLAATGEDVPFVLFSSSAVYGLSSLSTPMREDREIGEEVPAAYDGHSVGYATGKWRAEQLVLAAQERGRRVLVVRPFNVVGDTQSSAYGMVLPTFVDAALAGEPITVYEDGLQRRCFADVDTFTRCVHRLLDTPRAWEPGGNVVNVGTTTEVEIGDLARRVLAATGSGSPVVHADYAAAFDGRTDVRRRVPCTRRLADLVGEVAWKDVDEVIDDLLAARGRTRAAVVA